MECLAELAEHPGDEGQSALGSLGLSLGPTRHHTLLRVGAGPRASRGAHPQGGPARPFRSHAVQWTFSVALTTPRAAGSATAWFRRPPSCTLPSWLRLPPWPPPGRPRPTSFERHQYRSLPARLHRPRPAGLARSKVQ